MESGPSKLFYSSRLKERCPEGVYSFFVCPSVRPSVRNCHKNVRPIPNPRNMYVYVCVSSVLGFGRDNRDVLAQHPGYNDLFY